MKIKRIFIIAIIFHLFVVIGCAPKHPPRAKVTGTVTYKGKPIENGTIVFEVAGNRPATGKIVNGKIVNVTTFESNDGVSIGTAKIAISAREEVVETIPESGDPSGGGGMRANYMGMGAKSLIPPHYGNPSTSNLSATIEKGKENVIELKLD